MENKECCFGDVSISELMHSVDEQTKLLATETVEEPDEDAPEDSLTHYGIRGMKWGLRRYQNKDGSLTAAGKKRYNQELGKVREAEKVLKTKQATKAKIEKLGERKKAVSEGEQEIESFYSKDKTAKSTKAEKPVSVKKSIKDMSDEELRAAKTRLELERDYLRVYNELNPKKVSAGKEFIKKLGKNLGDATADAAKTAGKSFMEKKLKEVLGVSDKKAKSAYEKLKEEVDMLDMQARYNKHQEDKKLQSRYDKLELEKKILANEIAIKNMKKKKTQNSK